MANTIGWGKATQNNDNGFGKYQNTIGAASIYAESYGGETAVVGTSAAFSYSASSYNQGEADPTPTITGTTGGFFTSDAGVSFIDTSTGQIDLSASTIATHAITYIVDGVQSTQNVGITAIPYQSTRSFSFDGVNDYFDIGMKDFAATNGAISLWFNPSSDTNSQSNKCIIGRNTSGKGNGDFAINVYATGLGNSFAFFIENSTTTAVCKANSSNFPAGSWVHIIVTWQDGETDGLIMYVNGVAQTVKDNGIALLAHPTKNISIANSEPSASLNFAGNIDEVSLWDSALSSDAVTEIYNSGAPNDLESLTNASSSNLVAWYKMGE